MNNLHLKTFVSVVEAGSFNKAAEALYITPTAVIKHINLLESDLEVQLFERTHRGLILTKAGESLYKDAKYIMDYCQEAVIRARNAMLENSQIVRIGTSPIMPAQIFVDLWPKIHERCSDISFKLIPFENTEENAREILKNLGQNIDVVGGFVDETLMSQRNCLGLEIKKAPICCAVSIYHPLAAKDKLTVQDLYSHDLLVIRRGWCRHMDDLRDDLIRNHPQINLIDFNLYDIGIFNRCAESKDVLVTIDDKSVVIHPLVRMLPVEWEYVMPIGIMYSPQPSETVERFLSALKAVVGNQE